MKKKVNLDIKSLTKKFGVLEHKLLHYLPLVFALVFLIFYSFLVFRINDLSSTEPTDEQVTEKLQSSGRPKIDQSAINQIQQLQDNSVEVKTLFQDARNNPFHE